MGIEIGRLGHRDALIHGVVSGGTAEQATLPIKVVNDGNNFGILDVSLG